MCVFPGVSAVKIRLLDVPQMARVGHTVHLTCDYDLERQRLNQVKWYKGSGEIYRYSPGEPERQKLFLVKNLNVDVSFIIVMAFLLSIVINNVIIAFTILVRRVKKSLCS